MEIKEVNLNDMVAVAGAVVIGVVTVLVKPPVEILVIPTAVISFIAGYCGSRFLNKENFENEEV